MCQANIQCSQFSISMDSEPLNSTKYGWKCSFKKLFVLSMYNCPSCESFLDSTMPPMFTQLYIEYSKLSRSDLKSSEGCGRLCPNAIVFCIKNCVSLNFEICTENQNKSHSNSEGNTVYMGLLLDYATGIHWGSQNLFPVQKEYTYEKQSSFFFKTISVFSWHVIL